MAKHAVILTCSFLGTPFAIAVTSLPPFGLGLPHDAHLEQRWDDASWEDTNRAACTVDKMRIRHDFGCLAPKEREHFTDAIKCLVRKPSQLDQIRYPAASNRFMDYAIVHVNRTREVHLNGFFLTWHRYFLWLFEEELRNECGYKGTLPYWNWPETANDIHTSPVFDGSRFSMSGDGQPRGRKPTVFGPKLTVPHGSGGGCVFSGPFAGFKATMKPIPINNLIEGKPLPANAFEKHSHCLTRDLNEWVARKWTNHTALEEALEADSMENFDCLLNGSPGEGDLGLHSGAHFTLGSSAVASNIYVSAQDPIWYPLHGMLDLMYTSWQLRHPDIADSLWGTETAANQPPSAKVYLDSCMPDWGVLGAPYGVIKVADLMKTTGGPFCYKYDVEL
ncbi:uncharacterized protein HMPREF1541_08624 [Cyphellophora europaea CBS 101466]|uniref:Tyrosinase copper-binding domain-containing protein n=1 Tax=Cyphellophora europaea (strain CBS 101466) TaxID=1220924 RepID=W2RIM6_CYPE1|nr:uncharacterized protein HMPREF1541_08624 [Cyphellophora europaea CBS 101466]ETN36347.1 hypothetical protein HMPREF1541_08624 [Cyphellophora europaea CBS 101466]